MRTSGVWQPIIGSCLFTSYKTGTFNVTSTATNNVALGGGLDTEVTLSFPASRRIRIEWGAEIGSVTGISFGVELAGSINQASTRGGQREIDIGRQGAYLGSWVLDVPSGSLTIRLVAGATGAGGTRNVLGARLSVFAA